MANIFEQVLLPQRAGYSDQMALLDKAMQEYAQVYAAYRNQVDTEAQQATDRTIENLARAGKLTGASLAQAHAITNTWRAGELSKAQLQQGMTQAAGRQERAELASQRNAATASDVVNLGKFAVGAATLGGGLGLFSGKVPSPADSTQMIRQTNPTLTAVGENLMGLQGSPFTGQVMRQKYPELYQQPQYPSFSGTDDFSKYLADAIAKYYKR